MATGNASGGAFNTCSSFFDCPSPIKPLQDKKRGDLTFFNRLILCPEHHKKVNLSRNDLP